MSDSRPAPRKVLRFDPDYPERPGYRPDFLPGFTVPLPGVTPQRAADLVPGPDGAPRTLPYHHFSLVVHAGRRSQLWSAANVDYTPGRRFGNPDRQSLGRDQWRDDPRLPPGAVLGDADIYKSTLFDRGHVVRRNDAAWGETFTELEYANADTFHWTNATPQHAAFNQSREGGLWGGLEEQIVTALGGDGAGARACLYAGPVLSESDPSGDFGTGPVQYSLKFWKVVVVAEGQRLRAYAFVLDQSAAIARRGLRAEALAEEELNFGDFGVYQVELPEITGLTGVTFAPEVMAAQVEREEVGTLEARPARRRLARFGDVRLR